jgi:uncharacterized membrane protein YidH (DUF202 family)
VSNIGTRHHRADGLQPERTALAWTRTSLAVLANGALLLMKDFHTFGDPFRLVAAGCAVTLALITYLIGVRRQRILALRPLPKRITPRREIQLIAALTLLLILISVLASFL